MKLVWDIKALQRVTLIPNKLWMVEVLLVRRFFLKAPVCVQDLSRLKSGQDAELLCQLPGDATISLVRGGRTLPDQHPSLQGRVELKDPNMKDGDASVFLKNISTNDSRTHECCFNTDKPIGKAPECITSIELSVNSSGQGEGTKDGSDRTAKVFSVLV
ncbi:coxsackievirus and adenovirus receptor-like [Stegastes partitus]|uniref:Coxsackievirus and adenovirus receptor-like n=1 Tax=Stegastes partitus TaxID=144197 RepID=A0A9Y4NT54_9TELE|nr:PREDICTED: coxsackievirus and adenovirus receptor-like [Stegastes partitus]